MVPLVLLAVGSFLSRAQGKWVEGRVDTKENWAFLSRFCFLSIDGQFEYLIEFDPDMGTPNLLLYHDDDTQWPAVYHSSKTCKEREAVISKPGQNQIISLSHWYPDTEFSGCVLTKEHKELPASKSTSTTKPKNTNSTKIESPEPSFYDQFLETTNTPDLKNESRYGSLDDIKLMYGSRTGSGHKIERPTFELSERFRRLKSDDEMTGKSGNSERLIVSCRNARRFRSVRERWWFIAISNCNSSKGLDIRYQFLMTNGPDGDFWNEHFSADEAYVLPVLLTYTFAYVIVIIVVVMCSVELKSRHLLHSTYELFLISIVTHHFGVVLQSIAYIIYATNGIGSENAKILGQFLCGFAETSFLLLLELLAQGYTITRGRLKVRFTIKLKVFMCCYVVTYIVLFVYQATAVDPGEVLYLYESPAGYGLIVLQVLAWCVFAYSTFYTVKEYPEKSILHSIFAAFFRAFFCRFFICGTLWFHAGALFILAANNLIDKWLRESVVIAVLLFITFSGHIMFLLPVFNKKFSYHVRTTQIGVKEVTGASSLDGSGPDPNNTTNVGVPQTVSIPLTRRTEELISNTQHMATSPALPLENGLPKKTLTQQDSTETNVSDDSKPYVKQDKDIFTVEGQINKIERQDSEKSNDVYYQKSLISVSPPEKKLPEALPDSVLPEPKYIPDSDASLPTESFPASLEGSRGDLPSISRTTRNILEPIRRDEVPY